MKYERVEPDDPNRCQANSSHGQCNFKAVEGRQYCQMHGGARGKSAERKEELRNLKLTKFKGRLARLGNSSQLMSLRDEIAVARMTLEETVNSCEGTSDLITMSPQISSLVQNISKLVKSCHDIEEKTGHLLSKDELTNFASQVIDIIVAHVKDEQVIKNIAEAIVEVTESNNKNQT